MRAWHYISIRRKYAPRSINDVHRHREGQGENERAREGCRRGERERERERVRERGVESVMDGGESSRNLLLLPVKRIRGRDVPRARYALNS